MSKKVGPADMSKTSVPEQSGRTTDGKPSPSGACSSKLPRPQKKSTVCSPPLSAIPIPKTGPGRSKSTKMEAGISAWKFPSPEKKETSPTCSSTTKPIPSWLSTKPWQPSEQLKTQLGGHVNLCEPLSRETMQALYALSRRYLADLDQSKKPSIMKKTPTSKKSVKWVEKLTEVPETMAVDHQEVGLPGEVEASLWDQNECAVLGVTPAELEKWTEDPSKTPPWGGGEAFADISGLMELEDLTEDLSIAPVLSGGEAPLIKLENGTEGPSITPPATSGSSHESSRPEKPASSPSSEVNVRLDFLADVLSSLAESLRNIRQHQQPAAAAAQKMFEFRRREDDDTYVLVQIGHKIEEFRNVFEEAVRSETRRTKRRGGSGGESSGVAAKGSERTSAEVSSQQHPPLRGQHAVDESRSVSKPEETRTMNVEVQDYDGKLICRASLYWPMLESFLGMEESSPPKGDINSSSSDDGSVFEPYSELVLPTPRKTPMTSYEEVDEGVESPKECHRGSSNFSKDEYFRRQVGT